jgi:hypothetical protein
LHSGNAEVHQPALKGLPHEKIISFLIVGVFTASAFAATPTSPAAPVAQVKPAAVQAATKALKKQKVATPPAAAAAPAVK